MTEPPLTLDDDSESQLHVEEDDRCDSGEKAATSRKVSWVLDECVRVPGTSIRFGLDPILGLIPYGGETVATVIGATILRDAGKKGLPIRTLLKMGGNMMFNAIVGVIPFAGDLFSVWFKSNSRNYRLLNTYLESDRGLEAPGGWWPMIIIGGSVALVLLFNIVAWVTFTGVLIWSIRQIGGATL